MSSLPEHLRRRDDWGTPQWLFDRMHAEFAFTVDAAAHSGNHKLPRYWSKSDDGLAQDWASERVWCNPPYGSETRRWVLKASQCRDEGGLAVLLIPVRTDSGWWCDLALTASEIRFIRGRVHFVLDGVSKNANRPVFASAVLVFSEATDLKVTTFATPQIERHLARLLVPDE